MVYLLKMVIFHGKLLVITRGLLSVYQRVTIKSPMKFPMKCPMRSPKNTPSQGQMGDVPVGSEITFEVRTAGYAGDFMEILWDLVRLRGQSKEGSSIENGCQVVSVEI